MMRTKRLVAAVAAATGIVGMGLVVTAGPASAWDKKECEEWDKTHDTPHRDCIKYHTTTTTKAATTTTKKGEEATTTTVKGATTSTTVKATEHVEAVKATPTFTG